MNRRGAMASIIVATALMLLAGIMVAGTLGPFLLILDELKQEDAFGSNNDSVAAINTVQDITPGLLDLAVFVIFMALILGAILTCIFSEQPLPILFIWIILMMIAVFISGQFANVYDEVRNTPELINGTSQLTLTNIILGTAFPIIILIASVIVIIILYAKSRGGRELEIV